MACIMLLMYNIDGLFFQYDEEKEKASEAANKAKMLEALEAKMQVGCYILIVQYKI